MKPSRIVMAVLANLVAVVGPVSALYAKYGIQERVKPEAADQLFFLGAAMLAGFAISFLASMILKQATTTGYSQVIQTVIQALRDNSNSGPRHMRAKSA